jgi:ATP-dependent protease Clp ATPase subunit
VSETGLRCSFCGKRRGEVAKMIAGQRWQIGQHSRLVAICNECVALCAEMFGEQGHDPRGGPA